MRQHVVPLFIANGISFVVLGISYFLYSRLLTVEEFGAYAIALTVGSIVVLVLDGSIRASIIKHASPVRGGEESALLVLMMIAAALMLVLLIGVRSVVIYFRPSFAEQVTFVAAFTAVYVITYPWISLPTAQLERNLSYSRLAWIESTGLIIERGSPVLLLLFTAHRLYAFVIALALGRIIRVIMLACHHRVSMGGHDRAAFRAAVAHIREGAWFQAGSAASLVRDNLHVLIVGPFFGASWVGYYAWGLQLCMIASQVFVQISARVSLPIAAQARDFSQRWAGVIQQVRLLTAATTPALAAVLILAPTLNERLFDGKWLPALGVLGLLFARMMPGVATTPVGTLLLVQQGARQYALALWIWTAIELVLAAGALAAIGPSGLGVSYAFSAWLGIAVLLWGLKRETAALMVQIVAVMVQRPGLWILVSAIVWQLMFPAGSEMLSAMRFEIQILVIGLLVVIGCALDAAFRQAILRSRA